MLRRNGCCAGGDDDLYLFCCCIGNCCPVCVSGMRCFAQPSAQYDKPPFSLTPSRRRLAVLRAGLITVQLSCQHTQNSGREHALSRCCICNDWLMQAFMSAVRHSIISLDV